MLQRWNEGDQQALAELIPLIYDELRRIAAGYSRRERSDHTLQPTAIVHEVYLRLFGDKAPQWKNRAHLLGTSARVMRQVLVDHSRDRGRAKRGGGLKEALAEDFELADVRPPDLIELDDALQALARIDVQGALIVELRFFGGLTLEETADYLEVSRKTVVRGWRRARVWLFRELHPGS